MQEYYKQFLSNTAKHIAKKCQEYGAAEDLKQKCKESEAEIVNKFPEMSELYSQMSKKAEEISF